MAQPYFHVLSSQIGNTPLGVRPGVWVATAVFVVFALPLLLMPAWMLLAYSDVPLFSA